MSESDTTPESTPDPTPSAPAGGLEDPTSPAPEAPESPVVETTVTKRAKPTPGNWWWGLGRRKASVARVRIRPGDGKFTVNKRPFETYFPNDMVKMIIKQPMVITETAEKFDVFVNVRGGGITGQAGALRHGIARALVLHSPELRSTLKEAGFLTRDPREVERKKYGQPGARKRFQFSKR